MRFSMSGIIRRLTASNDMSYELDPLLDGSREDRLAYGRCVANGNVIDTRERKKYASELVRIEDPPFTLRERVRARFTRPVWDETF